MNTINHKQELKVPVMLTIKQTAKEFNIPEYAIRQWVNNGVLPCVPCGRKYLINANVFFNFLSGQPLNLQSDKYTKNKIILG